MKRTFSLLLFLFLLRASAQAAPGADLVLADEKSSPDVRIVVAKDSLQTPQVAAKELQRMVETATGQKWPISDAPSPDGINVVVGPNPAAEAAGIKAADIPPEGFRIAVKGKNLFIVGHDTKGDPWDMHWKRACQTGTLFGVIELARQYFHARWIVPGPNGEVLTPTKRLAVPSSLDMAGQPGFRSRRMALDTHDPEIARWARFNRIGWSHVSCFWHNWYQIIPPEVYGKDHPDWFALFNGKRQIQGQGEDGHHGAQLCIANPEVIKKVADTAVETYQKDPEWTMFSLTENDGGQHCECEACRAWDAGEMWAPGLPSLSDRFATFVNKVREAIGNRAPGLTLGYSGYAQGELPPVKTKIAPGIAVTDVYNDYDLVYQIPAKRERVHDLIKRWRESCPMVEVTSYFHGEAWWSLPKFSPEAIADLIKTTASYPSSKGMMVDGNMAFGVQGNEDFLIAELLWNPKADVSAVLDDYYMTGFGPGGPAIREYFDKMRVSFARAAKNIPPFLYEPASNNWVLETFDPIRADADKLIAGAVESAASVSDPHLQARVKMVADGWQWIKVQCDFMRAVKAYQATPTRDKAREVLACLDRREAFCKEHGRPGDYTISVAGIESTDRNNPFPTNRAEFEQAASGEKKSVSVPIRTSEGDFVAPPLEMVENRKGGAANEPTSVKVNALATGIEFAFEIKDANPERIVATATGKSGKVWNDDAVEIFLRPDRSSKVCYHLGINSLGTIEGLRHDGTGNDLAWDSRAQVTAHKTPDGWSANVVIPYEALGLKSAPLPGDIWGLNVAHARKSAVNESLAWSPTFGPFLRPERFGELIFIKRPGAT